MSSFPPDSSFVGPLPYHLASRLCQEQAQQDAQLLLFQHFPTLKEEHWSHIFTERRPLLWVDEPTKRVTIAEELLPSLVGWAALYEASLQDTPTLLELEGHYQARQLAFFSELARKLVADDPMLTHPESLWHMQAVFHRLCVFQ